MQSFLLLLRMHIVMTDFPLFLQKGDKDCGLACIKMLCAYYNQRVPIFRKELLEKRLSIYEIINILEKLHIETKPLVVSNIEVVYKLPFPFLTILNDMHFVIVYRYEKNFISISDPIKGRLDLNRETFEKMLFNNEDNIGKIILSNKAHFTIDE